MCWQISKSYKRSDFGEVLTLDDKLEIFRDRVCGWKFEVADELIKIDHSGFCVLEILFPYFEMIEQYSRGQSSNGHSKCFFVAGFKKVLQNTNFRDAAIERIYSSARCGMHHSGCTRPGIGLTGDTTSSFNIDGEHVIINPHVLLDNIKNHFDDFINDLKNTGDGVARSNFENFFDEFHSV